MKSRYPGLYVWSRTGTKMTVSVPDGCLLVQAGKQIEYLTGGYVLAGFHEVVVNAETVKTIKRKREKRESLWRVSSTLFSHICSDQVYLMIYLIHTYYFLYYTYYHNFDLILFL